MIAESRIIRNTHTKKIFCPSHNVKRKSLTIMAFFVSQQWELQQMNHGYGHISALNAP